MAGDLREQISRLETQIDRLAESVERCRKLAIGAKTAIGAGCILLASLLVGAIGADGLSLMLSAILIIGGIVLLGSNETTSKQMRSRIEETERLRAEQLGQREAGAPGGLITGTPPGTVGRSRTAWLSQACRGAGPSSGIRR